MQAVEHIPGETFHGRKGAVENAFTYSIDYVLLAPEETQAQPRLFSRNRTNLTALWDHDHGGPSGQGRGAAWAREVLAEHGLEQETSGRLLLLAQPKVLGHVFNPVSFWLAHDGDGALRAVIAEVTNTFRERHSYLCTRLDLAPIDRRDTLTASKIFYVSPFQKIEGGYQFRFDIRPDAINIVIDYTAGNGGVIATLKGARRPLTDGGILRACLRRPFGSRRVLGLIHWQALKLWGKGARYRVRPKPPIDEVSR